MHCLRLKGLAILIACPGSADGHWFSVNFWRWYTAMEILDRFAGLHGKITVVQERTTGARLYLEEGIKQSYVLPGGSAGLDYVRLMRRLLQNASDIGCSAAVAVRLPQSYTTLVVA